MCETQVKQCELIDHWKSVRTLFLKKKKKNMEWCKKDKMIDGNASFHESLHPTKSDASL